MYIRVDNKTYACKSGQMSSSELCLIDRHGGKWLHWGNLIFALGAKSYALSLPLRRVAAMEDFTMQHAVWVHTQKSTLARVHFDGTQLRVIEEIKMGLDPWAMITAKGARNLLWMKESMGKAGTRCLILDEKHMQ